MHVCGSNRPEILTLEILYTEAGFMPFSFHVIHNNTQYLSENEKKWWSVVHQSAKC